MKVTPKTTEYHRVKVHGYLPAMEPVEYQKVARQISKDCNNEFVWPSIRGKEVVFSTSYIMDLDRGRLVAEAMRKAGLSNVHWIRKSTVDAKEFV